MAETLTLFPDAEAPYADTIVPARRLAARAEALYIASSGGFETSPIEALELGLDGIAGDFHQGLTRRSGGREPWYPRGTEMRNERQLSIVAADELVAIAELMGLPEIKPEWIGANIVLSGISKLSMLPARTKLFFANGVTLKIDGQNHPCKVAGLSIAKHARMADETAGALLFPQVAKRLRGLVAWVEKPGRIEVEETVFVHIPEQWIYRA
ncbi:MAG: MOSC domain-containing protein [Rhizobiaceae bacterium]